MQSPNWKKSQGKGHNYQKSHLRPPQKEVLAQNLFLEDANAAWDLKTGCSYLGSFQRRPWRHILLPPRAGGLGVTLTEAAQRRERGQRRNQGARGGSSRRSQPSRGRPEPRAGVAAKLTPGPESSLVRRWDHRAPTWTCRSHLSPLNSRCWLELSLPPRTARRQPLPPQHRAGGTVGRWVGGSGEAMLYQPGSSIFLSWSSIPTLSGASALFTPHSPYPFYSRCPTPPNKWERKI